MPLLLTHSLEYEYNLPNFYTVSDDFNFDLASFTVKVQLAK